MSDLQYCRIGPCKNRITKTADGTYSCALWLTPIAADERCQFHTSLEQPRYTKDRRAQALAPNLAQKASFL
jgi:hypothetical protein